MRANLLTVGLSFLAGTAVFVGILKGPLPRVEGTRGGVPKVLQPMDASAELAFYGGFSGETEVGRIKVTAVPVRDVGGGEYLVEVPGAGRPIYLSEPYAVIYFDPVSIRAGHYLVLIDSSFSLSAGGVKLRRVLPRPITRDGAWDGIFYRGAVSFEPVPVDFDGGVVLDVPYAVDPGTPIAIDWAHATVEFPAAALRPR